MELIDTYFKSFKLNFNVKPTGIIHLSGVVPKIIKYYNLKDEMYLHLNYVSKNVFLYKVFSLEGMEINYYVDISSFSSIEKIPADPVEQQGDLSLVKSLSYYGVVGSSQVFVYLPCIENIVICLFFNLLIDVFNVNFRILMLISFLLHC